MLRIAEHRRAAVPVGSPALFARGASRRDKDQKPPKTAADRQRFINAKHRY
jgi:hypothetical protein